MEILFKSDDKVFFIEDDELDWNYMEVIGGKYDKTPHINEFPILCHIIDNFSKYPVYYNYKNRFVIFENNYDYYIVTYYNDDAYRKDYTQVNINNIINGNII